MVFHCAVEYHGTSLNGQVLQGPDVTNKLVGVMLIFRKEPFASIADIGGMYHQVKVHPDDVDALRFLCYPYSDLSKHQEEFHMSVHRFGGIWSASCANYGRLRTAQDTSDHFDPLVVSKIMRNFYVDDCLKSIGSQDAAFNLVDQLHIKLLQRGCFSFTMWICNSRSVL